MMTRTRHKLAAIDGEDNLRIAWPAQAPGQFLHRAPADPADDIPRTPCVIEVNS